MSDQLENARLQRSPSNWPIYRLKHLARLTGGGTPLKENIAFWEGGDIPWVSPKDMKRRTITETEDYITEAAVDASATSFIDVGSPMMVVRSGILRHTLPVAIAGRRLTINQDMKAFKLRRRLDPRFFVYWVEGQSSDLLLEWRQFGATVESIDIGRMMNGRLAVPDPKIQKLIAHFLDRETARVDQLIEKEQQLIFLLEEKANAERTHIVLGSRPHAQSSPPDHWQKNFKLAYAAAPIRNSIVNGPFGSDLLTSELLENGVPVIYSGDIKDGPFRKKSKWYVTEEKAESLSFCSVHPNDLLMAKVGDPPGIVTVYPDGAPEAIVTQDVIRIRLNTRISDPYYMYHLLNSQVGKAILRQITIESTRGRFPLSSLRQVRFPLPPLNEQKELAEQASLYLRCYQKLSEMVQASSMRLREFRSALITAAVTGQIDVATWGKRGETDRRLDRIAEAMRA